MKAFVATLLLAVISAASAAPSLWGPGAALAGPHTGPNSLVGPSNGPSALAGPVVGPARISGAVDLGAVVTGAVAGPSAVHGSVSAGTAVLGGPHAGYLGVPAFGQAIVTQMVAFVGHGAVLAGPIVGPAHLAGPIAPGALIAGPSGYINAGHGLLAPGYPW
ncbi:tetra-peptide repeat homeobox protein 1-like [Copidosoma floridanum]|uniref:tetra-peptide repeat homeobox protein 1-like n=1 Tax=Copidosoma floridanum TaxID=29053 RepID=UPI0006C9DE1C|nr:tetra-peptide repeat homeobox protein 1-like [Copidosoma floridanum]